MKKIYLKEKREKAVLNGHPWIFSGAIKKIDPAIEDGEIVSINDSHGMALGCGYYNSKTQIAIRMLLFGDSEISLDHIRKLIESAIAKRTSSPLLKKTNACRLIFSEGDFLPGLIVDRYEDHLVVQFLTMGMDRLKNEIIAMLIEILKPKSIQERSDHEGRALEGLKESKGMLYGTAPQEIIITENNMEFIVDIKEGQKTGFFLDQRDNRHIVKALAENRSALNLCSYTGAFTIAALSGGASSAISVDSSLSAIETAKRNAALNGYNQVCEFIQDDVFNYLRKEKINSDLIILDPPALAKNRATVENACKGYKDLNLQIAKKCPSGTILLTCSCSRFIDMNLFQMVVFSSFADAQRKAAIIGKFGHPCDHPVSLFCPETEYLKAILLIIE